MILFFSFYYKMSATGKRKSEEREENEYDTNPPSKSFKSEPINIESVLQKYPETQAVYKNKNLQRIFRELEENNYVNNDRLEDIIRRNDWVAFDAYCLNETKEHFWQTLQTLFYLYYYAPEKIDYDTMQKGLGIQQTRWSVSSYNDYFYDLLEILQVHGKFDDDNEFFKGATLITNDNIIVDEMFRTGFYNPRAFSMPAKFRVKRETKIKNHLLNSIWYKTDSAVLGQPLIPGFGRSENIYGIPASYDFSSFSCMHQPQIIFGNLKPASFALFIIYYNRRPYAGHLPDSKSNMYSYDGIEGNILTNWKHDFGHQSQGLYCDIERTISNVHKHCGDNPKFMPQVENETEITNADWLKNKNFIECLHNKSQNIDDTLNNLAMQLTDDGNIFRYYDYDTMSGGKKKTKRRRQRRSRKTKKRRRSKK